MKVRLPFAVVACLALVAATPLATASLDGMSVTFHGAIRTGPTYLAADACTTGGLTNGVESRCHSLTGHNFDGASWELDEWAESAGLPLTVCFYDANVDHLGCDTAMVPVGARFVSVGSAGAVVIGDVMVRYDLTFYLSEGDDGTGPCDDPDRTEACEP